jgi:glycosyl transferase family 25
VNQTETDILGDLAFVMHIFVINMKRSVERRRLMEKQLNAAGLKYEFWAATDGTLLPREEFERECDVQACTERQWTPGQIGCALSHGRLYRHIVEQGIERALILEDDLILRPDFGALIPKLEQHLTDDEIIMLYFTPGANCTMTRAGAVPVFNKYQLMYPMSCDNVLSTAAYMLSGKVAERMVKAVYPMSVCADHFGAFYERGGFSRMRCVMPQPMSIAIQLPSTIGTGQVFNNPLLRRSLDFIREKRVFPFSQMLYWQRVYIARQLQKQFSVTDQPSPFQSAP